MKKNQIEILIRIISSAFVAEYITMMILLFIKIDNYYYESLADSLIMSIIILPFLYWWVYRPIKEGYDHLISKEQIYRKLIESTGIGFVITSIDGKILDLNNNFKNMISMNVNKVKFEKSVLPDLFKKSEGERIYSTMAKIVREKKPATIKIENDIDGIKSILRLTFNYVIEADQEQIFILCQEEMGI